MPGKSKICKFKPHLLTWLRDQLDLRVLCHVSNHVSCCVCAVTCSICAFWRKLRLCAEWSWEAFASPMGMPSLHPLRQLGQRWPWPWAYACTHTKQWDYFLWLSHHPHTLPAAVCMKACIKLSLHQSATWCQSIKQYNNITHTLIKNKRHHLKFQEMVYF